MTPLFAYCLGVLRFEQALGCLCPKKLSSPWICCRNPPKKEKIPYRFSPKRCGCPLGKVNKTWDKPQIQDQLVISHLEFDAFHAFPSCKSPLGGVVTLSMIFPARKTFSKLKSLDASLAIHQYYPMIIPFTLTIFPRFVQEHMGVSINGGTPNHPF